ncbi:unnamed protein product [Scytosiphon promiscuus]
MGALVQGQPLEQVAPYMYHAWMSLSQCFDTFTVEIGRAFLMMAYLHNFMGDDHKFSRYLQLSRNVVDRLPGSTVQTQEIDYMLMMGNDTRIFHTAALAPAELEAYCTDETPALQVPHVVHKSDLCRLLLQADRRMMKAFLRDHRVQAATPLEQREELAFRGGGDDKDYLEVEATAWKGMSAEGGGGKEGYLSGMSIITDGALLGSTKMDDETDASCPGDETWKCTVEARDVVSRLEEAANVPEIRNGIGSLLYNSILGYLDMVTGSTEIEASFAKVKHCVGIISRYPGLCRFSTWRHLSHCQLSFLFKVGETELYEELRQAYNSVRAEGAPAVPPHTEWAMIGFCDHIFCRSMDHLGKDWGGAADSMPIPRDVEEERWLPGESHWLNGTQGDTNHRPSLAPKPQNTSAIPHQTLPTHEWTDVMPPSFVDSGFSTHQLQHMAPAPEFPAVGPLPTTHVGPVWSMAGQAPAMSPFSRSLASGSVHGMGVGADVHTRYGWDSRCLADASNPSADYHNAGDMWRYASGMAADSSFRTSNSNAHQVFDGHMLFNAAVREGEYSDMSGGFTSDMGEPEDSNDD